MYVVAVGRSVRVSFFGGGGHPIFIHKFVMSCFFFIYAFLWIQLYQHTTKTPLMITPESQKNSDYTDQFMFNFCLNSENGSDRRKIKYKQLIQRNFIDLQASLHNLKISA